MEEGNPVRSVTKALALLDRIALGDPARAGVSLAELARECRLPPNTAHNLLKSLIAGGYVERRGRGVYAAGGKCAQVGRVAALANARLREGLLSLLRDFAAAQGEAAIGCVLVNGERVTAGAVDSTHAVRVAQATVEDAPFFAKPTGRLLAALADESELRQILSRQGYPGARWDGIRNEAALREALATLREQGWALVEGPDLVAMACPVLIADGRCWGVLGTFAPAYRCAAPRRRKLLAALQRLSREWASRLDAF